MRTWSPLLKKTTYSAYEAKLATIFNKGILTYELTLEDTENHEEKLKAEKARGIDAGGKPSTIIFLRSRPKTLTRVKVQFIDALEFVMDEIVLSDLNATNFARVKLDGEEFQYPSHYEGTGTVKRKNDISEKATGWDLFLTER